MVLKKSENGREMMIEEAPFKKANALKKAFEEELKNLDYDLGGTASLDLNDSIQSGVEFLLSMDTSERFEMAVYDCLKHCTYENVIITEQLFDDMKEAREDYYEIIKECVVVNLRPFMKSLSSQFPILKLFMELYQNILLEPTSDSK